MMNETREPERQEKSQQSDEDREKELNKIEKYMQIHRREKKGKGTYGVSSTT